MYNASNAQVNESGKVNRGEWIAFGKLIVRQDKSCEKIDKKIDKKIVLREKKWARVGCYKQ